MASVFRPRLRHIYDGSTEEPATKRTSFLSHSHAHVPASSVNLNDKKAVVSLPLAQEDKKGGALRLHGTVCAERYDMERLVFRRSQHQILRRADNGEMKERERGTVRLQSSGALRPAVAFMKARPASNMREAYEPRTPHLMSRICLSCRPPIVSYAVTASVCTSVRCGAVRCGAVRCGAVRCGAVRASWRYLVGWVQQADLDQAPFRGRPAPACVCKWSPSEEGDTQHAREGQAPVTAEAKRCPSQLISRTRER